jgi:hypothetical protein
MEKIHNFYNRIFAAVVFAIAFAVFLLTTSPTVAFWDCGEYVATGHSLGVPHPPGNPLFMMILRVSSILLPFFEDVGYRMNFAVVLFSAATAMFIYLIAVRVGISIVGLPDTTWKRLSVYVGGIVAGLFAVFGSTFWFSAVEASEANPAMMFVAVCTWLVIKWAQSTEKNRDILLILLTFISFLGIGVHMYSMIVLPPIFLFIILADKTKRADWRVWITAIGLAVVIKDMPLYIFVGAGMIAFTGLMSIMEGKHAKQWQFCFWISLFAYVGFSTHLYIPIRSALDPMINENAPSNWIAFKEFLERKQYGSEDMFSRMFWRRGTWAHQLGVEGHMGYGGFHLTQFFRFGPHDTEQFFGFGKLLVYLLPTFFMVYGWYYLFKKNRNIAIFLGSLFLLSSIGLVLYMNFSDGTRSEYRDYLQWAKAGKPGAEPLVHREVRIRDYFWAAGFMYLGMWMGIAATALMHFLYTHKDSLLRKTLAPVISVLLIASPALPLTQNWAQSTRKGDFVPYDYAYNLLMSCEKEGILFTNGDNDTFPLWALQEAYGIRRDVRIVNLSLVNTKWYIKQLKKLDPKVPISYTERQIDNEIDHRLNPITDPTRYTLPQAGITVNLPTRQELNALRVQDQMVVNIVDANKWKKPVYFAVTVSDDNLMGLGPYLKMQGLVYRVMPQVVTEADRLDIPRTVHLLDNVYKFRGLGDGKSQLNDTSEKLLSNYAASYIQIALTMRKPLLDMKNEIAMLGGQTDTTGQLKTLLETKKKAYDDTLSMVLNKLDQCVSMMPWDWRPRMLRHETLLGHGRAVEAEAKMREALTIEPENSEYLKMLAQALEENGKKTESTEVLKKLLNKGDSDPWFAYASLAKNYEELGKFDSAITVMNQFSVTHPGDRRAAVYIQRLNELKNPKPTDTAIKAELPAVKAN